MAKPSTFRVLMVWIDGWEAFADAHLNEELLPEYIIALDAAGAARRKGFLLLARKNWELEFQARLVRMPRQIQGLFQLPDGQAVDRLIGYEDEGGRWHPGLAGLQQAEARVLRMRIIRRQRVAEVAWALSVRERTIVNHMAEARRKLRQHFGLYSPAAIGVPYAASRPVPIGQVGRL
jgi:DNA-binding CsgD family transcriptional regulator